MIKAIFFDLFNTLVHHYPLPEDHQGTACRECGIEAPKEDLLKGYWAASDFFTRENARLPLDKRSEQEKHALWIDYETTLLREAGVDVPREKVIEILGKLQAVKPEVVLFEDTVAALTSLRDRGLQIGVISNLDRSVEEFCFGLDLESYLDFSILSCEVGFDKPHPEIFNTALRMAQSEASEAIMIGDQYHADIVGARKVGIKAILIDRNGLLGHYNDCPKVSGLNEIMEHL